MEIFDSPCFSAEVSLNILYLSVAVFVASFLGEMIKACTLHLLFSRNVRFMRGNLKWYPLCSVSRKYDFADFFATFYVNVHNFQANDAYPNYCLCYVGVSFGIKYEGCSTFERKGLQGCFKKRKKPQKLLHVLKYQMISLTWSLRYKLLQDKEVGCSLLFIFIWHDCECYCNNT